MVKSRPRAARGRLTSRARERYADPTAGRLFSARFVLALLLVLGGIAWMAYYYVQVRVDPAATPAPEPGSPAFMADLQDWNYAIGFGAIVLGLMISSHPSTPLGRGRGVVVGMLGCFLIGLIWICTFYVFSDDLSPVPVLNDLGQLNLLIGVAFMGVGFAFSTKWT